VQRKWAGKDAASNGGGGVVSEDEDHCKPVMIVQSGSTPVKSLTGKFDKENLIAEYETCADAGALRQLVGEQMRDIETLKSQGRRV
jgi:hypothetical protein